MPRKDKQLQKEYFSEWYQKNLFSKRSRAVERYNERNTVLREHKRKPCSDCGNCFPPYVMDFDHVRGEKKFNLSKAQSRKISLILEEIEKCDLVCSNCHRLRTHLRWCKEIPCSH